MRFHPNGMSFNPTGGSLPKSFPLPFYSPEHAAAPAKDFGKE
jgi:hypothetical protein